MLDIEDAEIKSGDLHRVIIVLAIPLLLQNMVRVAQSVIDLMWLGRYSSDAVSAVGLAIPILGLLLSLVITGPFVGTQVIVSQRIGNENRNGARRATFVGVVVGLISGIMFGGMLYLSVGELISLLTILQSGTTATQVVEMSISYLRIISLGVFLAGIGNIIEASFVGYGDSRASLYINVITVFTNISLDPFFIFGIGPFPQLGVEGAAIATVLGYAAGFGLGLLLVKWDRQGGILKVDEMQITRRDLRELLAVGLPISAQSISTKIGQLVFVIAVFALGGAGGLAAYIIASRVSLAAYVPATGLRDAAQSVVGQNLGANQQTRANRAILSNLVLSVGLLSIIGFAQLQFLNEFARLLAASLDSQVFRLTVEALRISAYGYPAVGALYTFQAGFNGAGRSQVSFVSSIIRYWMIRLPIVFLMGLYLGGSILIVFWAIVISDGLTGIFLGIYYKYQTRLGMLSNIERTESELANSD